MYGNHRFLLGAALFVLAASLLAGCSPAPSTVQSGQPTATVAVAPATATPVPAVAAATATTAPPPTAAANPSPTTTAGVPTAPPTAASPVSPPVAQEARVSGEQAYQHVQALAGTIGSRPAGSDANRAAQDYIADRFRQYGYAVEVQAFDFSQFVDRGSQVKVRDPEPKDLEAHALSYSGTGEVEGDVVTAGLGRPTDFPAGGLAGKVALIRRGELIFQDKVDNAVKAGAAAVMIYNQQGGEFRGALRTPASLPVVALSQSDGEYLLGLLQQGAVRVQVKVDAEVQQGKGHNVVATRPGTSSREVVIGGHFDSVDAGPGANDNASGTGTVLEVARVMAGQPYSHTLRFIAFDVEELGLLGSRHYVQSLSQQERGQVVAMINLDMVGVGDEVRYGGNPKLVAEAIKDALAMGLVASELKDSLNGSSDHASFIAAEIPAVFFHRVEDPNYHTAEDKLQYIEPRHLESAGRLVMQLLTYLETT